MEKFKLQPFQIPPTLPPLPSTLPDESFLKKLRKDLGESSKCAKTREELIKVELTKVETVLRNMKENESPKRKMTEESFSPAPKQTVKKQKLEEKAFSFEPSESVAPSTTTNTALLPPTEETKINPKNQILSTTFWNHMDAYFRPFTKDDLLFLLPSKMDDPAPFLIPSLGKKYLESWSEEEKSNLQTLKKMPTTSVAKDVTNIPTEFYCKPISERIIACLLEEDVPKLFENSEDEEMMDVFRDSNPTNVAVASVGNCFDNLPLLEKERIKEELYDMEDRLLRELRYIGVLDDEDIKTLGDPEDEITRELRRLQNEFRIISKLNNHRKEIVMEKVLDHLAYQEYRSVVEEVNRQIDNVYQRRYKNQPKKKKKSISTKPANDGVLVHLDRRKRILEEFAPIFPPKDFQIPTNHHPSIFTDLNDSFTGMQEEEIIEYINKPLHAKIPEKETNEVLPKIKIKLNNL